MLKEFYTARDKLTIHDSKQAVYNTIQDFSSLTPQEARFKYKLGIDTRDWKVDLAQKDILDSNVDKALIQPILYRPFDIKFTFYTYKENGFICRPRRNVMQHMILGENLGLITIRRSRSSEAYRTFL